MAHALVVDGLNVMERQDIESRFEPLGHEIRAELDPVYKRETWGLRPEDIADIQALTGESPRWQQA